MHKTSERFRKCLARLTEQEQNIARRRFELLKTNPEHPSLHFKKVGGYWSVRIDRSRRALALKQEDDYVWFWIGPHDEYDRLINER